MPPTSRARAASARSSRAAGAVLVLLLVAAGCGDDGDGTSSTTTEPVSTTVDDTTTTAGDTATTQSPDGDVVAAPAPLPAQDITVGFVEVARANSATAMATRANSTTLYIAERAGGVRPFDPASGSLGDPIIDISSDVSTDGERGLLGLTFSPDGNLLYLSYTNKGGDSRLDEYTMNGDEPDLASKRTVLGVDQPASNHNGGEVRFGPDGMLWWGLGDGGGSNDEFGNAQNLDTLLGNILRIDPSGRDAGEYSIPPDNPFASGGGRPEIWLYGMRNPWRFSFDRANGDLWIADVGQGEREEIDVLRAPERGAGANLQWPLSEGSQGYLGEAPADSVGPIYDYERSGDYCSITGGYVYRGEAIPELQGAYLFGDYCEGTVRALFTGANGPEERALADSIGEYVLVSFGEGNDGELYVLGLDGRIQQIVPA